MGSSSSTAITSFGGLGRHVLPEEELNTFVHMLQGIGDTLRDILSHMGGTSEADALQVILRAVDSILPFMLASTTAVDWKAEAFNVLESKGFAAGHRSFVDWFQSVQQVVEDAASQKLEREKVAAMQRRLHELGSLAATFVTLLREWNAAGRTFITMTFLHKLQDYKDQTTAGIGVCHTILAAPQQRVDDWQAQIMSRVAETSLEPVQSLDSWLADMTSHLQTVGAEVKRIKYMKEASNFNTFQASSSIVTLRGLHTAVHVTYKLCKSLTGTSPLQSRMKHSARILRLALQEAISKLQANESRGAFSDVGWDTGMLALVNGILKKQDLSQAEHTSWVDWMRGAGDMNRQLRQWLHTEVPNELKVQSAAWLWHHFVEESLWPQPDDITQDLLGVVAQTDDPILFVQRAIRRRQGEQDVNDDLFTLMSSPPSRSIPAWFPGLDNDGTTKHAPRMDPFLGLKELRGVASFRYMEPKPEWIARFPHLPILVLLGDIHRPDACTLPCDEALGCKRVGGPTHSFVKYLDESPLFDGLDPDFVFEHWVPKHHRDASREQFSTLFPSGETTLMQTAEFLWDCVGPLKSPRCPLKRLRVHVADIRNIMTQQTLTRLGASSAGLMTDRPSYLDLFGFLIVAGKQGQPQQFVDACAAAYPGWDMEDIVRSLFSLDPFEDIDNPWLRGERVAHEFYQLDPAIQATIREFISPGAEAALLYPYDIVGAVLEWLHTCKPGQVMHPLLASHIEILVNYSLWLTPRWTQAVDIYAVSRFLKRPKAGARTSKFVAIYLGVLHTENIASLLRNMYDTYAYTADLGSGCLNLSYSMPLLQYEFKTFFSGDIHLPIPDWPVAWDTASSATDELDMHLDAEYARARTAMALQEKVQELKAIVDALQGMGHSLRVILGYEGAGAAFAATADADLHDMLRAVDSILPSMIHLLEDDNLASTTAEDWKADAFNVLDAEGLAAGHQSFEDWFQGAQEAVDAVVQVQEREKVATTQRRLLGLGTLAEFAAALLREPSWTKILGHTHTTLFSKAQLPTLDNYRDQCAAGAQACQELLEGQRVDDWQAQVMARVGDAGGQLEFDFWLADLASTLEAVAAEIERINDIKVRHDVSKFQISNSIIVLQGLEKSVNVTRKLYKLLPVGHRGPQDKGRHHPATILRLVLREAIELMKADESSWAISDLGWDKGMLALVNSDVRKHNLPEAQGASWVDWMRGVGDMNRWLRQQLHTEVPNDSKVRSALWLWQQFAEEDEDMTLESLEMVAKTEDPIHFVQRAIRRRRPMEQGAGLDRPTLLELLMGCPPSRSIPAWFPGLDHPSQQGPQMDPFLGLAELRGVASFRYMEPKQEWAARFPHLPILVLLGDIHRPDACTLPCDEALHCTRVGGPSHSFVKYLDESHLFDGLDPDFVFEHWVPKHHRDASREQFSTLFPSDDRTLMQTAEFLWDCAGPLKSPRCPLKRLRVHVADIRNIMTQQTLTRLGASSAGLMTDRPSYLDLFGFLIVAGKQGQPQQFVDACAAAYPGWHVEDIVRSLFSLDPFEDIDNPWLRGERVAHEFYQLDPAIQATIREFISPGAEAALLYPYDIPGAVLEWLHTCKPGQVMHPLLVTDIEILVTYTLWFTPRWTQAVDIYAVSRFLKTPKDDGAHTSKFVVMYFGLAHTENIASLLRNMYDTYAYTSDAVSGCVDLTRSYPFVQAGHGFPRFLSSDHLHVVIPDWPVAWDTTSTRPKKTKDEDQDHPFQSRRVKKGLDSREAFLGRVEKTAKLREESKGEQRKKNRQ